MTTLYNGMKRLSILTFALLSGFSCAAGHANPARYVLRQQELRGHEGRLLRLYDRQMHQLLWKMVVDEVRSEPAWSADHHALAIFVRPISQNAILLIWKAGQPLRRLPTDNPATGYLFDFWDGILNTEWSPDKTRLLVRAFYSGGGEFNSGQLLCYVLDKKRFYEGPKGVRRAKWIGPQQVRYWRISYARPWIKDPLKKLDWYELPPESKHSDVWHCP